MFLNGLYDNIVEVMDWTKSYCYYFNIRKGNSAREIGIADLQQLVSTRSYFKRVFETIC